MKKEENILTVLMYLFKHHVQEGQELDETLFNELENIGFNKLTIHNAFHWLENLAQQKTDITVPQASSIRVFTPLEKQYLNTECQSYLLFLQQHILDPVMSEIVFDQLFQLKNLGIDVSLIQWVTLMVLYNHEGHSDALNKMEFLVLQNEIEAYH
tara:strand:- start:206 stop:670 length:465 start_codon:yes stop_codon:yes gene_type:complete